MAVCPTYLQQPSFLCKANRGDGLTIGPRHASFTLWNIFVKEGCLNGLASAR